jgi:hypothetical protein
LALTACAAENAAAKKSLAAEIDRICALPDSERQDALDRLKRESGYELQCGRRQ